MELYKDILIRLLENEHIKITFENLDINFSQVVELECYKALNEIKTIVSNDGLDDTECFQRIEEIICLFEKMGIECGNRHDFG